MKPARALFLVFSLLIASACPWNDELRAYLSAHFWLPFAKNAASFEKPNIPRINAPFAGMAAASGDTPLHRLRRAYQALDSSQPDIAPLLAIARAALPLSSRDREEIDLIEAKVALRLHPAAAETLHKFEAFLQKSQIPEFQSEARGWLARLHYLSGRQAAAGRIYLDELNRPGSNLSRETLLTSLRMTYGYDGGPQLIEDLDQYFDTPEHAAFAIQLATNPHGPTGIGYQPFEPQPDSARTYRRIQQLLAAHPSLLESDALALLAMRTALRMGDPAGALKLSSASKSTHPDFLWMKASALFLSRSYAEARAPLVALFRSSVATPSQRAAAAYALCGVAFKTGNPAEQLRYALWLRRAPGSVYATPSSLADLSVYWAASGWDLNLLLESEVPLDTLQAFIQANPGHPDLRLLKYALAVRLSRAGKYSEAAALYESIQAIPRARRLARLAELHQAARTPEARLALAAFLAANPDRLFYNDTLWGGFQRYALRADDEYRLTRAERSRLLAAERELRDAQEERWQAWLILRGVIREAGPSPLGREAAALALRCLRLIRTDRFGREAEIRRADFELSRLFPPPPHPASPHSPPAPARPSGAVISDPAAPGASFSPPQPHTISK